MTTTRTAAGLAAVGTAACAIGVGMLLGVGAGLIVVGVLAIVAGVVLYDPAERRR